jgi:type II secretory pathway component PulM
MRRLIYNRKEIAIASAAVLALLAFFTLLINPIMERIETLNRVIPEKQKTLSKLQEKADEYIRLSGMINDSTSQTSTQTGSITALSSIEQTAEKLRLNSRMAIAKRHRGTASAEQSSNSIEIQLKSISLEEALQFIKALGASAKGITIERVHLKTNSAQKQGLDANIELRSAITTVNL